MDPAVPTDTVARPLDGARVAFTGRLATVSRRAMHQLVRDAGGVVTTSVSGRTTHLVVGMHGWPLRDDGGVSTKLQQAERLRDLHGRLTIVPELRFLESLGQRDAAPPDASHHEGHHTRDDVAELLGLDVETIRRWHDLGLLHAVEETYDFRDLVSLQTIAGLVNRGVALSTIQRSLVALGRVLPGTDRPLAQLTIVGADDGALLAQIGETLIAPDGQQVIDFDRRGEPDAPVQFVEPKPAIDETPDDLIEQAVWLEQRERYDEAAALYRRVLGRQPDRADVHFNLGNALRMAGRDEAAEELYRLAVAIDGDHELAWYNLADLLESTGRLEDAVACLREAVTVQPAFADGHFNLASCLEQLGEHDAARPHWQRYLRLDPASEWAEIARARLARSES